MSHEPKPSEHAMLTAASISSYLLVGMHHSTKEGRAEIAHQIQEHAIAPAVAERDRRIAELEAALAKLEHAGHTLTDFFPDPGPIPPEEPTEVDFALANWNDAEAKARAVLAKAERSAP